VRRAGDILADLGHDVVEATPPSYEEIAELWAMLLLADLAVTRPLFDAVMSDDARTVLDALVAQYPEPTATSAVEVQGNRFRVQREWSAFFQRHPVVLSPTWGLPAFEHDADMLGSEVESLMRDTLRPVLPGNLLGIPAAVVPCGEAAGLPVGVQVMGDRFTDLRCLSIAGQIQDSAGVPTPIDPVT
jgi:amidase